MTRNYFVVLLLVAAGLTQPRGAMAGAESHGGGALHCPGMQPAVQVLDLWEAENELQLTVTRTDQAVNEQVRKAIARLERLNPDLAALVAIEYARLPAITQDPPPGKILAPPSDTKVDFIPRDCQLQSVAKYKDDAEPILWIDRQLFSQLSPTDQAALLVHESLYAILRKAEDTKDSVDTRKLTGMLFAAETLPELPLPAASADEVVNYGSEYYFGRSQKGYFLRRNQDWYYRPTYSHGHFIYSTELKVSNTVANELLNRFKICRSTSWFNGERVEEFHWVSVFKTRREAVDFWDLNLLGAVQENGERVTPLHWTALGEEPVFNRRFFLDFSLGFGRWEHFGDTGALAVHMETDRNDLIRRLRDYGRSTPFTALWFGENNLGSGFGTVPRVRGRADAPLCSSLALPDTAENRELQYFADLDALQKFLENNSRLPGGCKLKVKTAKDTPNGDRALFITVKRGDAKYSFTISLDYDWTMTQYDGLSFSNELEALRWKHDGRTIRSLSIINNQWAVPKGKELLRCE